MPKARSRSREIEAGKIKFVMHGHKLKGVFTLVRIKPREGESGDPWLLFKDRDEYAKSSWDPARHARSVKSGKTLAEVAKRSKIAHVAIEPKDRHAAAPRLAAKRDRVPSVKSVMLATLVAKPFDDDEWLFEIKWDGYRAICTVDANAKLSLRSRNGLDLLARFPQMAALADAFASIPIVVDGEICQPRFAGPLELPNVARGGQDARAAHVRRLRSALRRRTRPAR